MRGRSPLGKGRGKTNIAKKNKTYFTWLPPVLRMSGLQRSEENTRFPESSGSTWDSSKTDRGCNSTLSARPQTIGADAPTTANCEIGLPTMPQGHDRVHFWQP